MFATKLSAGGVRISLGNIIRTVLDLGSPYLAVLSATDSKAQGKAIPENRMFISRSLPLAVVEYENVVSFRIDGQPED